MKITQKQRRIFLDKASFFLSFSDNTGKKYRRAIDAAIRAGERNKI